MSAKDSASTLKVLSYVAVASVCKESWLDELLSATAVQEAIKICVPNNAIMGNDQFFIFSKWNLICFKSSLFGLQKEIMRQIHPFRVINKRFNSALMVLLHPMKVVWLLLPLLLTLSCNNNTRNSDSATSGKNEYGIAIPAPGTVVAADSMVIPDPLNELYFSVRLVANEQSQNDIYDVVVRYGFNDATTQISLPRGADKPLKPALKKSAQPFTYIVGFYHGDDPAFNDYFLISAGRDKTEMRYIKTYSFR